MPARRDSETKTAPMREDTRGTQRRFAPALMVWNLVQKPQKAERVRMPPRWLPTPRFVGGPLQPRDRRAPALGRIGPLEVRLARSSQEVKRCQQLRYHVFYEEMSATPDAFTLATRRDRDRFDPLCDHMVVVDHDAAPVGFRRIHPRIVGTYRMLRREVADRFGGFYSESEFDLRPLLAAHEGKRFLELGRSCVLKPYRNKRTVELLWHGVWSYVLDHRVDVMIGCASLEGTDPKALAAPLSYLYHNHLAPEPWRVSALPGRRVSMNLMPAGEVDPKVALRALPPLVKGYLRLGGFVADGAVVDRQFGTTDILIVLPVSAISSRYINYYGADAGRYAA